MCSTAEPSISPHLDLHSAFMLFTGQSHSSGASLICQTVTLSVTVAHRPPRSNVLRLPYFCTIHHLALITSAIISGSLHVRSLVPWRRSFLGRGAKNLSALSAATFEPSIRFLSCLSACSSCLTLSLRLEGSSPCSAPPLKTVCVHVKTCSSDSRLQWSVDALFLVSTLEPLSLGSVPSDQREEDELGGLLTACFCWVFGWRSKIFLASLVGQSNSVISSVTGTPSASQKLLGSLYCPYRTCLPRCLAVRCPLKRRRGLWNYGQIGSGLDK